MLTQQLHHLLFLDIETVPQVYHYKDLPPLMKSHWEDKWKYQPEIDPEEAYQKAGIYAEFGKIICISVGQFYKDQLRIKSFHHPEEKNLLQDFCELLHLHFNHPGIHRLCAHNGKEFDFPYLCRRLTLNGIPLPSILQLSGKKPWEIPHLDTLEMWKFGDYKHYTSLALLATIFGLPSPKEEIKGSDVAKVYYEEKNLEKIVQYCEKDVITLAAVYKKYVNLPETPGEHIIRISNEHKQTHRRHRKWELGHRHS